MAPTINNNMLTPDINLTNLTNLRPRASFLLCLGKTARPRSGPANAPATCAAQPTLPQPTNAGIGNDAKSALASNNTAPKRHPA